MTWVIALFEFGLIGVLLEMWLSFQQKLNGFYSRQSEIQQQIAQHKQAIAEVREKAAGMRGRIEGLEMTLNDLNAQAEPVLEELQRRANREAKRHPSRQQLTV